MIPLCALVICLWVPARVHGADRRRLGSPESTAQLADRYEFKEVVVPDQRSLTTVHAFHVCTQSTSADARPVPAKLELDLRLEAIPSAAGLEGVKDYRSIQVSLMSYDEFWRLVNPQKFCCDRRDQEAGKCEFPDQLLLHRDNCTHPPDCDIVQETVPFRRPSSIKEWASYVRNTRMTLERSGTYILVLSNCGGVTGLRLSGSVAVRNPIMYSSLLGCSKYADMPGKIVKNLTSTFTEAALSALFKEVESVESSEDTLDVDEESTPEQTHLLLEPQRLPQHSQAHVMPMANHKIHSRHTAVKIKVAQMKALAPWVVTLVSVLGSLCCSVIALGICCHVLGRKFALWHTGPRELQPRLLQEDAENYSELQEYVLTGDLIKE